MNDIPAWIAIPAAIFLVAGGLVTLIGSVGLIRFEDFKSRIHAPTLGNTFGTMFTLLASILLSFHLSDRVFFHEIIIMVFLFLTSPVTTMLLMRSYILRLERIGK
ncbi:monovalent cation/H(+) antiporter subunit G [Advenella sp. RU8]|uniref:monovalent cation/H(+) antiporter subunit G n=1 Tax=Advenella sp. RU8 TaxID=3399575 RepID=UPI003AB083A2